MTNPVYNQNGFGFYQDTSGWNYVSGLSENGDCVMEDGTNVILRLELEVTNTKAVNNWTGELWASKKGGGYTQMTTGRTDGCRIIASSWFTDADADNNDRLSSSSLTFVNGELDSDGILGEVAGGIDLGGQDHWEIGICIEIDTANAASGDYWDFEIRHTDDSQLNGYTRWPRITYTPTVTRRVFITRA